MRDAMNPVSKESTMNSEVNTIKDAAALLLRACRLAVPFFLSIEVWLMVAVAAATVAGFWLAFLGDLRSVAAFGFAGGYLALRPFLHVKRILAWPFM
jgi:hypothetical protein